jgi:hypothetical protein
MNIYHVGWTQIESFRLNAVVIAAAAERAKELWAYLKTPNVGAKRRPHEG